jgi:maltooligosyltrehalose trehalohydrolase
MKYSHSMPFGAELTENGDVRFRLWAPKAQRVDVLLRNFQPGEGRQELLPLEKKELGWFELRTNAATAGTHYQFQIDGELKVPDPASRFQPSDVHGPSEVVNPKAFDWSADESHWRGRPWEEAVIYELHVGAFTSEGTFRAVIERLDYLSDLGVTAVELMPVSDFPGQRNWGYDGVLPYAPDSTYGRPEDLKRLVQTAHEKGLMIFLDVVYNHFGPDGNYLSAYAPQFFTSRHHTPWGDGLNFDGPESRVVRDFFIHSALYWLEEYRFDGLRLDAVHAIADDSEPNIITELAQVVRQKFCERRIHLILENADNGARYLKRDTNSNPSLYDAQWNDDLHHAVHVLITGESDGYYSDYSRQPIHQLCRCLAEGFAYQGDYSGYHHAKRGEPSDSLPPTAFISFLQNHDQIGNRAFGERIGELAPARAVKAAMEILLLAPSPPFLFMGEEFGATSPFLFFCDFHGELASAVTKGRRNEFSRFAKFSSPEMREQIPNPNAVETFLRSKLDWLSLGQESPERMIGFYRELLSVRQRRIVPLLNQHSQARILCCSEEKRAMNIEWAFKDGKTLVLHANLGEKPATFAAPPGTAVSPIEQIYSSGPEVSRSFKQGCLPEWSVVWLVRDSRKYRKCLIERS